MAEQKCDNCNNYDCSWHVKFEPVPGWKAKPTKLNIGNGKIVDSYAIKDCPEFTPNRKIEKEKVLRNAPCCLKCSTRSACISKNMECNSFRRSQKRISPLSLDKEVKRLFEKGYTVMQTASVLNTNEMTVRRAKKRLGLQGRADGGKTKGCKKAKSECAT